MKKKGLRAIKKTRVDPETGATVYVSAWAK